jgi:hypothetical protein
MNMRRSFLKGAGIVGAFAVGVASYRQVKEVAEANRDISHLAPPKDATTLQIMGSYGPKKEIPPNTFYIASNGPTTNRVSMTVGKDDRLWIKVGEEWKRVSIEG